MSLLSVARLAMRSRSRPMLSEASNAGDRMPVGGQVAPLAAPDEPTLFALLANSARRASDRRLAACCVYGLGLAGEVVVFHPAWWLLALPAMCLASFGAWGLAERAAAATCSRAGISSLRAVQVTAAVLGTLAGLTFLFGAAALCIGSWTF